MIREAEGFKQIQLANFKKDSKVQNGQTITKTCDETIEKPIQFKQSAEKQIVRVKSKTRIIFIGLIISLSAVMFGYSLKQITSVPIGILVAEFDITMQPSSAQSILIGILPLGSVLGAILTKFLIKRFKRLAAIYIFTLVNCGAVVLINITKFESIVAGRFLQGICIGYYSAIAPIYLRQIAPKQLRKLLGLFFSLGKIVGVLIVIVIELILEALDLEYAWRIILSLTGLFSVLQAVLIFLFGSDTPTQMIEKGESEKAKEIIKKLYVQKYVEEVYREYTQQYEAEVGKGKQTMSQNLNQDTIKKKALNKQPKNIEMTIDALFNRTQQEIPQSSNKQPQQLFRSQDIYQQNSQNKIHMPITTQVQQIAQIQKQKTNYGQKKRIAYTLGVHLCVIRHFIGGNAIITQGGLFIKTLNPSLGHYTSLIINLVQFAFIIFGLAYLQKIMGKKPLFLLSIAFLCLLNFGLAVGMIFEQQLTCMFLMCLYMAVYGAAFISPVWAYPSEIIPASESLLPNIMHWVALAISTLIPPLVTSALPRNNSYPVFIFFGIYGIVGFMHVKFKLRQSDGFTYDQIIASFK